MVTRQVTPRHPCVLLLLLIVPFLLPLAGCDTTTPTKTEPPPAGTTWTVASFGAGALDGGSGTRITLSGVAWNGTRFVAVGAKGDANELKEFIDIAPMGLPGPLLLLLPVWAVSIFPEEWRGEAGASSPSVFRLLSSAAT